MRRSFFSNRSFKFILGGLVFLFVLITIKDVYTQPPLPTYPYTLSAHGNTTYGVNRTGLSSFNYSIGNCAHCHEQHASIAGDEPAPDTGDATGPDKYCLLSNNFNTSKTTNPYAQSDSVCFYCHIYSASTLQSPSFNNYSYSITFGGNPDTTPSNIFDTFNSTSYHNLYDVYRFITGLSGTKTFPNFPADNNPCSGCHNVHIAKRSCGKPTGSYDPTKSAISKPSDHNNLWGDDTSERLNSNFTTNYQAPYWYGTTNYEPNNSTTYDGTNLPDYVTFCTNCHTSTANSVWSTTLNRWLRPIDWGTTGDKHGKRDADGSICVQGPYSSTMGKVLSCLDCHEPHGAPNVVLIRKEVNGGTLDGTITTITQPACNLPTGNTNKEIAYLCDRCHKDDKEIDSGCQEDHWYIIHHDNTGCNSDRPYNPSSCGGCHTGGGSGCGASRDTNNCNCCHYHGSSAAGSRTF